MEDFWTSLKCIRCGACMNTCPVYRRSGGLSYGATYSGPIGVIIDPTFNLRKYSALPYASTMNGSCTNVCPVKINIHEQIYTWRKVIAERHQLPMAKKEAMRVAGRILGSPRLYRAAVQAAAAGLDYLPRFMIYNPFNAWGKQRELPATPPLTFRQWYLKNRKRRSHEQPRVRAGRRAAQPAGRQAAARGAALRAPGGGPAGRFSAALERMGGTLAMPPAGRLARQLPGCSAFPQARVICSATPEVRGTRAIARRERPARVAGRRRRRGARGVRRRRNRLGGA